MKEQLKATGQARRQFLNSATSSQHRLYCEPVTTLIVCHLSRVVELVIYLVELLDGAKSIFRI